MNGHHLVLGELSDYITGETLPDTHDERYRQALARLLVEHKGYGKDAIKPRQPLIVRAGDCRAVIRIDYVVTFSGRLAMVIKYGPGSIVTRHRSALAVSRLLAPYQIPVAVATNGEDADVLEGASGRIIGQGLGQLPEKSVLKELMKNASLEPISAERAQMESRVAYAYEVDGSCPCDDTICRL
jgi:hypothetical protein